MRGALGFSSGWKQLNHRYDHGKRRLRFRRDGLLGVASWKRLRIEIANLIREHAWEEEWCQCFVSCGEYEVAAILTRAAALPQALAEKLAVEGLPAEVVDAVRISCGFSEKERDVAEGVARCIPEFEQDALVKWVEEQQPLAASALAEGKAYALPSKRRLDVCIRLKRAWGSLFAQWCGAVSYTHLTLPTKRIV